MAEKKYRDAESGEYVTEEYAKAHPKRTVAESDSLAAVTEGETGQAWVAMWCRWLTDCHGIGWADAIKLAGDAFNAHHDRVVGPESLDAILDWMLAEVEARGL